jgi:hypothetical protein
MHVSCCKFILHKQERNFTSHADREMDFVGLNGLCRKITSRTGEVRGMKFLGWNMWVPRLVGWWVQKYSSQLSNIIVRHDIINNLYIVEWPCVTTDSFFQAKHNAGKKHKTEKLMLVQNIVGSLLWLKFDNNFILKWKNESKKKESRKNGAINIICYTC